MHAAVEASRLQIRPGHAGLVSFQWPTWEAKLSPLMLDGRIGQPYWGLREEDAFCEHSKIYFQMRKHMAATYLLALRQSKFV